jgi:hypothetical protein
MAGASFTSATCLSRIGWPFLTDHQVLQILDARTAADLADQVFAALRVEKAAAGVGAEIRNAASSFSRSMPSACSCAGFSSTRYWRTSPPIGITWAMPGMVSRRGRITQSAYSRTCHRADLGRIGRNGDQQDLAHDRGDRPELRHDARRQLLAHQVQALGDLLPIAVDVGAPFELDIDDRQADAGHRAHARHAGHAVHARFDREGDQLLDFLRRHAAGLGHQRHGGLVEVGEDVDRHLNAA